MGLIRVVVFGLAIWLLYKFYSAYKSRLAALDNKDSDASINSGTMIKCSECATYIPKDKAISSGAQWFCCAAHQKDFEQKNQDGDQHS